MDSNWRPKEGWRNPTIPTIQEMGGYRCDYEAYRQAFEAGASAIIPAVRQATLKEVGEKGIRICLVSYEGKPVVEFGDGDCIDLTGTLTEFLMHLGILMPNCELLGDLTIIPTKALQGEILDE